MNERQEMVMEAINAARPSNGWEYDAITVQDWYWIRWQEYLSIQQIAQHLRACPLSRRALNKQQQWQWFKRTGHWVRIVYQNRQTGYNAYPDSIANQKRRQLGLAKHLDRLEENRELREQQQRELGEVEIQEEDYNESDVD